MTPPIPFQTGGEAELLRWEAEIGKRPKQASLRTGYAVALNGSGDPAAAIEQASLALALDPRQHDAAWLLAALLQRYELNDRIDVAPRGLEAAFAFGDVDRQALSVAAIRYLALRPSLAGLLDEGRTAGWDAAANTLLSRNGQALLKDRLFRAALANGYNTNADVEFLLTAFRRRLLLSPDRERLRDRALYDFACALIRQCIANEYVFAIGNDELEALAALEADPHPDALLLEALYGLPSPRDLEKRVPRALRDVLQAEWAQRRDEADRAAQIPRLTEITDGTSQRVEQQYADDPYPRWLSLQTPDAATARDRMSAYFAQDELAFMDGPFDVLIAGCGTGQQAVGAALEYGPGASCLAIDLSRRSLAYASRMAERFAAGNLRFAQADILGLGASRERFDVIECIGVLHHMARPFEAWRILVERLKPGGLMLIGLYSAVSRRNFEALWNDPASPGPGADDDALRRYRRAIMERRPGEPGTELLVSRDFHVKSGFRDLVLHVSEQQCALPDIRRFLDEAGLAFHGFRLPPEIQAGFFGSWPEERFPGSLETWWRYEQDNPRTFDGMYVFWCRKT